MISEEEKENLKKEALNNNISYSEYVRGLLFNKNTSIQSELQEIKIQMKKIVEKLSK